MLFRSLKFHPKYTTFYPRWQLQTPGKSGVRGCKKSFIHLVFTAADSEKTAQYIVDKAGEVCYNPKCASGVEGSPRAEVGKFQADKNGLLLSKVVGGAVFVADLACCGRFYYFAAESPQGVPPPCTLATF